MDAQAALEESFFLGLRMNRGVSVLALKEQLGDKVISAWQPVIDDLVSNGLLDIGDGRLQLTARGRLLSNEVFVEFLNDNKQPRRQGAGARSGH